VRHGRSAVSTGATNKRRLIARFCDDFEKAIRHGGLPGGNGSLDRDDGKAKLFPVFSRRNETTSARMNIRALARD
jgi:hypothetical protein